MKNRIIYTLQKNFDNKKQVNTHAVFVTRTI